MTRWRLVRDPEGRYNVLSDRQPGPMVGAWGDLRGWEEVYHDPGWLTFEAACQLAADGNGKQSTANMGPREAAERDGAT